MKCVRCKSGESEKSFENHSSDNCHDEMYQEYVAREEGYVYVFVSNENPTLVEVYFDDVTVTITPGNVIQANEYYPYGLQTTNSWTRSSSLDNNFLYNGGTELNKTTQVYDLYYRNYDPALGRFGQVDPMASMLSGLSPYNYANGEPIRLNDPLGNCPTCGCMVCDAPDLYLSPKKKYEGGSLNAFEEFVQGNFSRAYGEANGMGLNGAGNYGMWRGNMFNQGVGNGVAARADAYRRSYSESTGDRQTIYQSGMQQYILNPWAGQEGAPGKYYAAWVEMDFNLMAVILLHGFNVVTATVERYEIAELNNPAMAKGGDQPDYDWLGNAGNVANIFGIATTISINGPRPRYIGPTEWAGQIKAGTKFGNRLGYLGLGLTAADMVTNGVNTSNTLDLTFGVVSFGGLPGAIIGGVYFLGNLVTQGITGKTIGQHVDDNFYIVPSGIPQSPFMLIPKN